jgi:hypothetical protein
MDDDADKLKETIDNLEFKIIEQNDNIIKLTEVIDEILIKDNKDANYLSELFEKDIDEYVDEILAAYESEADKRSSQ